eukprot:CAMPEP_0115326320 /NCGR_PEP_ID=MMETSP0270-20121206/83508_1 /TAXON_ID=71861 /ORGANISM="Scrippsiella trochoidea, Strain CCMP3099" /LENGTH=318 /DNA_ID=CAMNT_0002746615 /DNA_START=37 /DNA_END=993 /DNA_ORIENTATION=+
MSDISTSAGSSHSRTSQDDELKAKFERLDMIGSGVYGKVYQARNRETGEIVALKTLCYAESEEDGVPPHIIREGSILMSFEHPNVVRLFHVYLSSPTEYHLVLEYIETDLHQVIKQRRVTGTTMPLQQLINYSHHLLCGIHACHVRLIAHRDLKPQNVLVSRDGLKICDFGLSRWFSAPWQPQNYTHEVITLWYRAPEVLLGGRSDTYGPEVDMWSAGCVIAEMATSYPMFPGESEISTIFRVMKALGTPTEETWPGHSQLENWSSKFPQWPSTGLALFLNRTPELGVNGGELLKGLLVMNPEGRLNARRAKNHAWFR